MSTQHNEDWFTYEADFAGIAAGIVQNQQLQVQRDADFTCYKLAMTADIAGGAVTVSTLVMPLCTLLITDTGSGRSLSNLPVPVINIFGQQGLPFILPVPRTFTALSTVTLALTNYSAGTTYNVRLSLIGVKQFMAA